MITPTVGRKVWYRPSDNDKSTANDNYRPMVVNGPEPLDATIVAVWSDRCVNLAIFDIYANVHERRSVTLVQDGDVAPTGGRYAEWMPYQLGQAKKDSAS